MRFLILLLFIGTFVGCEPEFGFETNLNELDTVSFTISGETSGSTLPDINVNNLIDGNTYSIHTNNSCSNEVLSFSYDSSTGNIQLSGISLEAGSYRFYLEGRTKNDVLFCMDTKISFTVLQANPDDPVGGSRSDANGAAGSDANISFSVNGLTEGNTVKVFTDASCTTEVSGSSAVVQIGDTSVVISIVLTAEGDYQFYIQQVDENDNSSSCIDSNVSYTYDTTDPSAIDTFSLATSEPNPGYGGRLSFTGTGTFAEGETFEIFYQGDCDTGSILASANTTSSASSITTKLSSNLPTDSMNPMIYARVKDAAGNTSACTLSPLIYSLLDTPALGHTTFDVVRVDNSSSIDINVSNLDSSGTDTNLSFYLSTDSGTSCSGDPIATAVTNSDNYRATMPALSSYGTYYYSVKAVKASGGSESSCSSNLEYQYVVPQTGVAQIKPNSIGLTSVVTEGSATRHQILTMDTNPNFTIVSSEDLQGGKVQVYQFSAGDYCGALVEEFDVPSGTPVTSYNVELTNPVTPIISSSFHNINYSVKVKTSTRPYSECSGTETYSTRIVFPIRPTISVDYTSALAPVISSNFNSSSSTTMATYGFGQAPNVDTEIMKVKVYRNNNCSGTPVNESAYLANSITSYEFTDDLTSLGSNEGVVYSSKVFYASESFESDCVVSCAVNQVANSDYSAAGSITGTISDNVEVTCNEGYSGGGNWTCGANGLFTGASCTANSCTATQVANSDFSTAESLTGTTGQVVEVTCDSGYTGGGDWTCGSNGSFSGNGCTPVTCTQNVSRLASGASISGNYNGGAVSVSCAGGYSPNVASVTCQSTGQFDQTVTCEPTDSTYLGAYADQIFNCNLNDLTSENDTIVSFPDSSFAQTVTIDSNLKLTLPTAIGFTTNFYVDWGDSNCSHITNSSSSEDLTHNYTTTGTKSVRLIGNVGNWGVSSTNSDYSTLLTSVENLGKVYWTYLRFAFSGAVNLSSFNAGITDTSNVTSMAFMFYNARALEELDLSAFNTSSATTMSAMFSQMSILTNLNISEFNLDNVNRTDLMFSGMSEMTSLDLSHLNVSNVVNMQGMFSFMRKMTSLNTTNWETSSLRIMKDMFRDNDAMIDFDLKHFDTSNVTNMERLFYGSDNIETIDISSDTWDTSNVTNMTNIFNGIDNLTSLKLGNLETDSLTSFSSFFNSANVTTSNSNTIVHCSNNADGNVNNGNEFILGSTTYPCVTPDVTCTQSVSNLASGDSLSQTTADGTQTVSCAAGYIPSSTATCQYDGTFQEGTISCQPQTAIARLETNSTGISKNYSNRDQLLTTDETPNFTVVTTEDIQGGKIQIYQYVPVDYCGSLVEEFDVPSGSPVTSYNVELSSAVVPDNETQFDFMSFSVKVQANGKAFSECSNTNYYAVFTYPPVPTISINSSNNAAPVITYNFNENSSGNTMDLWGFGRTGPEVLKAKIYRNNDCSGTAINESAYLSNTTTSYVFTDDLSSLTESQDITYSARLFYDSETFTSDCAVISSPHSYVYVEPMIDSSLLTVKNIDPRKFAMDETSSCAIVNSSGLIVDNTGDLWCWGEATKSGHAVQYAYPVKHDLGGLKAKQVVKTQTSTCVLLSNDEVKCWGSDDFGMGNATDGSNFANAYTIYEDGGITLKASKINGTGNSSGSTFCAVETDGGVSCWGQNNNGVLGGGLATNIFRGDDDYVVGVTLPTDTTAQDIVMGGLSTNRFFACAHLKNASDQDLISCWGEASQVANDFSGDSSIGDDLLELGNNMPTVNFGSTGRTISAIYQNHDKGSSFVIHESGDIVRMLGHGALSSLTNVNPCLTSSCTDDSFVFNYGVVQWSSVDYEQKGVACFIDTNNKAWCKTDKYEVFAPPIDARGYVHTLKGQQTFISYKELFPYNVIEMDADSKILFVWMRDKNICTLNNERRIRCFGSNLKGQLGQNEATNFQFFSLRSGVPNFKYANDIKFESSPPTALTTALTCNTYTNDVPAWNVHEKYTLGYNSVCAIVDRCGKISEFAGRLFCWGSGSEVGHQLTHSSPEEHTLTTVDGVDELITEISHMGSTCMRTITGKVKCVGSRNYTGNKLDPSFTGTGTYHYVNNTSSSANNAVYIISGDKFSVDIGQSYYSNCSLGPDSSGNSKIYCWGKNDKGQAGVGTTETIIGDDAADAFNPVDLPVGVVPRLIFGGYSLYSSYSYNCFLATNEKLYCWGHVSWVEAGFAANYPHAYSPVPYYGDASGELGNNMPYSENTVGRKIVEMRDHLIVSRVRDTNGIYSEMGSSTNLSDTDVCTSSTCTGGKQANWNVPFYHDSSNACWGFSDGKFNCYTSRDPTFTDNSAAYFQYNVQQINTVGPQFINANNDKLIDVEFYGGGGLVGDKFCLVTDQREMKCFGKNSSGECGQGFTYEVDAPGTSNSGENSTCYNTLSKMLNAEMIQFTSDL